jgi:hypothetical protein
MDPFPSVNATAGRGVIWDMCRPEPSVIPAKAGIHRFSRGFPMHSKVDSLLREENCIGDWPRLANGTDIRAYIMEGLDLLGG